MAEEKKVPNKVSWWNKFWGFIGDLFKEKETGIASMTRLICLLLAIASIIFGWKVFEYANAGHPFDKTMLLLVLLSLIFAAMSLLGKNVQKIIELGLDKFKNKTKVDKK